MEEESYGLEEIQAALLNVLTVFDGICRDNGICYSLHGGTLLGAERNHRFIPWDDDIDVSMKRSEYKKLQAAASQFPKTFELNDCTTWVPRLITKMENGDAVCLDIFVWDYISTNKVMQKAKIMLLRFFQGTMKPYIEYERFGLGNKILLFVTHVIGLAIPSSVKHRQFNHICEKMFLGNKGAIHRSNDSFVGVGHVFDSEYMDEYSELEFEGRLFMVNKRYHEVLERSYGKDYMTPPPKAQRIPQHEGIRKVIS